MISQMTSLTSIFKILWGELTFPPINLLSLPTRTSMTNKNNITGDTLISKPNSKEYEDGYDLVFRKENIKQIKIPDLEAGYESVERGYSENP